MEIARGAFRARTGLRLWIAPRTHVGRLLPGGYPVGAWSLTAMDAAAGSIGKGNSRRNATKPTIQDGPHG